MASLFHRLFPGEEEEERPKAAHEGPEGPATNVAPGDGHLDQAGAPAELPLGLIPASKLPPAAEALAELFAEPPVAEAAQAEKARQPAEISEPTAVEPPADAAPKKRGIFARLLTFKRPPATTPERLFPFEKSPAEEFSTEPKADMSAETPVEAVAVIEAPELGEAVTSDIDSLVETLRPPILAETLPSAATAFEEIFPPEDTPVEAIADASAEVSDQENEEPVEEAHQESSAKSPGRIPVEELVEVATSTSAVSAVAEGASEQETSFESRRGAGDEFNADTRHNIHTEETPAQTGRGAARLGSREAEWPYETQDAAAATITNQESASAVPGKLSQTEPLGESHEEPVLASTATPEPPHRLYKDWAFDEKLAGHREWVESHGMAGQRADLAGAELEASDLISVNLRLADLHDANLRASDLLLADLRDACLVRADLEEACLVGANLEGANLEGASLETAMGLVPRQFAGANLRDALMAPQLMEFEAVAAFQRASQNAYRYFGVMTAMSVLSWLVIWKTRDAQLLTDSAIIPFLHSRAAAAALPTAETYLIAPALLFIAYLLFHFHLQRLWDAVMELPAIFPDGHTLGDRGPGIITGLLRTHFRWMNPDPSSTRLVEKGASLLLAYWIVPPTLLLFWARYLTRQEIHGTILQALLATVATGGAAYATTKVGRPQERWAFERKWAHRIFTKLIAISPISVATVFGIALLLLSAGTIAGVPHERSRAPQYGAGNIRRWAPNVFWWLAYDPYADLTEAAISRRPANWTGADDQVSTIDGLRSNNARFRYAQAYGAFFANSRLWRSDFKGAFLSEADLRGADLGQSNLQFAVMDHAQMGRVNLDRSNLDGADLRRADLRGANLSYCSLTDAILVDARLDGASFYTARLAGATLTRANLEKADLRESFLAGAHMDHADLQNAYLWSAKLPSADLGGAQLASAILIDADLHGANLGGAQLTGTVLNGADLSGASLEGADLRGALGLSANQVCSAKSRRGVVLDPDMQTQVEAQCGK